MEAGYNNLIYLPSDSTLVTLGEDLDLDCVFTLDHRGFSMCRLRGFRNGYPPHCVLAGAMHIQYFELLRRHAG